VGFRVGLDRCGKSLPHRDSIPGPSSPQAVAIPTTLPGPRTWNVTSLYKPAAIRDLITSYTKGSPVTKNSQQQKGRKAQENTGKWRERGCRRVTWKTKARDREPWRKRLD